MSWKFTYKDFKDGKEFKLGKDPLNPLWDKSNVSNDVILEIIDSCTSPVYWL